MSDVTVDEILAYPLKHDHVAGDISDAADNFLLLDQTTPQNVINGIPTFDDGIKIKAGRKVIYDAP